MIVEFLAGAVTFGFIVAAMFFARFRPDPGDFFDFASMKVQDHSTSERAVMSRGRCHFAASLTARTSRTHRSACSSEKSRTVRM